MAGELIGLGEAVFAVAIGIPIGYLVYQIGRYFKITADTDERKGLLEIAFVDQIAKSKGIDLDKVELQKSILAEDKKSFKKAIEQELYESFLRKTTEEPTDEKMQKR